MILQIDHIAISTLYPDKIIKYFTQFGYTLQFIEKNVNNLTIKRDFLQRFHKSHDLAYLSHPNSYPIEIINHHSTQDIPGYLMAIVPAEMGSPIDAEDTINVLNLSLKKGNLSNLDIPVFLSNDRYLEEKSPFHTVTLASSSIDRSLEFWNALGFREVESDSDAFRLSFRSPLRRNLYELIIRESSANESTYSLDSTGFSCMAFISSSIQKEKNILQEKGFVVTETGRLDLQGKSLSIAFALGPSNEIVEIIEITQ